MNKLFFVIPLTAVLGFGSAHAADPVYTYICKNHGKKSAVVIDEGKNTLTWNGAVYSIKQVDDCGRYGWHAEKDGVGFDFCTATQGVADFDFKGTSYDCDMKR